MNDDTTSDTLVSFEGNIPYAPGQPHYKEKLLEAARLIMGNHKFSHSTSCKVSINGNHIVVYVISARHNNSFTILPDLKDWKSSLIQASKL